MKSLDKIKTIEKVEDKVDSLEERAHELHKRGSMRHLADIGWAKITSKERWEQASSKALEKYLQGTFFIERLGRGRETDPEFMATLLHLREQWIKDYALETIPELLLLDCALVSYYHFVRTNSVIGNLEAITEDEFFFRESPRLKWEGQSQIDGFWVDKHVDALVERFQPMLDRFNRMFIRNLKAIRDLKRSNQILNIGSVEQVNIGEKQVNVREK